jgi:lipopolysaccharide biosynthesis glycosyltransferase
MRKFLIVLSLDDNFVMPCEVFINSLINNTQLPVNSEIALLYESSSLSIENITRLDKFIYMNGLKSRFLNCQDIIPAEIVLSIGDHVTRATYFRLFFFELLIDKFNRIYYFDIDMIVCKNIQILFDIEFDNEIAAVDHYSPIDQVRLWGSTGGTYFNAGLLIYNMDKFRPEIWVPKYVETLIRYRNQIKWHDQDVLNITHKDMWHRLPYEFNINKSTLKALDIHDSNISIIHYDGWNKPWKIGSYRKFESKWHEAFYKNYGYDHPKLYWNSRLKTLYFLIKSKLKEIIFLFK